MIPELGHFALCLATGLALVQFVVPMAGAVTRRWRWAAVAQPAAVGQFIFVALSYAALTWAFVVKDFSVLYVVNNANDALPLMYRLSAVWGAHEGSLLLWVLILAVWTLAVSVSARRLPSDVGAIVIAMMGAVSLAFLLFTLLTSNPFERLIPAAADGKDLNPLLQDPGLIIHPPMLYMGYVGFSVAFAFAIAALVTGRLDTAWARWTRPWTTTAWLMLTIGIALGSWWAYSELGWGGWWFWDPVENASFMPWLVGTALIHSLAVTEKRGLLKSWTVLLAISAFALSLLGTFLVRSGVLVSVHAFATDPQRGVFVLAIFTIFVAGSLLLYALRAGQFQSSTSGIALFSREGLLLLNNVFLTVAALAVLLGTLYPLFVDAMGGGKLSVGPPYFNAVFVPLTLPLVLLVGLASAVSWKRGKTDRVTTQLRWPLAIAVVVALIAAALAGGHWLAVGLSVLLGVWAIATAAYDPVRTVLGRGRVRLGRAAWGMSIAHMGLGVFVIGVGIVSAASIEKDVRLDVGESETLGAYTFTFEGVREAPGPNYTARIGAVEVSRSDRSFATLAPEKRFYPSQENPMTEASTHISPWRDVYVSLGEPLQDGDVRGAWSVRLYVKPFIRWIWLGSFLMALGGGIAASDRRYRLTRERDSRIAAGAASA